MFNLALLNPKAWVEIALALALSWVCWHAYNWIYDRGFDARDKIALIDSAKQAQASAKVATDALTTTKSVQESADAQRSDLNAQIVAITGVAARAVTGLSNRPNRPADSGVSTSAGDGKTASGCTGSGLYQPDARFLVGEAANAAVLRASLKACYAQYDEVKAKLNGSQRP